jgi:Arc/MetJ-type ribon-helix-helix transcriptional regulator
MHGMATRRKRSISLPPDLDAQIQAEVEREGVTYSAWLLDAARKELKVRAGLEALAGVEKQIGPFTSEELAEADEWARETVERKRRSSRARRAA